MGKYRGLSGIGSALFIMLVVLMIRDGIEDGRWIGVGIVSLAGALFFLKVGYEIMFLETVFVNSDGNFIPIPVAHLAGAAAGAFGAMCRLGPGIRNLPGGHTVKKSSDRAFISDGFQTG